MPCNARQFRPWIDAVDRGGVGVANSACFHPNPDLTRPRLRHWPFHCAKRARFVIPYASRAARTSAVVHRTFTIAGVRVRIALCISVEMGRMS
jgi:hypothetical protein